MVAIQEISGRIGRVTGHGIAGNVCRNFPAPFIWSLVILLLVANTINIAADLGAMADATKVLIGGWSPLYVVVYAVGSVTAQVFLFAYVVALAVVHVPWGEALRGLLIPNIQLNGDAFLTTLIAILGTTISPYLFVWQSSQEAEDQRIHPNKRPLRESAGTGSSELRRIRLDTMVGLAFSNLIAIAIMITTAATLHSKGITHIRPRRRQLKR
jgi:Mn2+/Fe2+ NRAMP family transporter